MFPRRCPFCGRAGGVCKECEKKIVFAREPICKKCGKPLTDERKEYCEDCMRATHVFVQGRSLLSYQGDARDSLYRFKYGNKREYADYYAQKLWQQWGGWVSKNQIDLITAVPLYAKKERRRGYNQAWVLAKRISRISGIPSEKKCLARIKKTAPQKNLTDAQRRKNLKGAFLADANMVKGRRILLIDDIYTTGSTADAAAGALLLAGCGGVYVLTAAIGG